MESVNKYVLAKEWGDSEKPRERWISQNEAGTMSSKRRCRDGTIAMIMPHFVLVNLTQLERFIIFH
jgi:hypothetical protein